MLTDVRTLLSRRRAWLLAAVFVVALLVLVIGVLPPALVRSDGQLTTAERLKAENDIRSTLVQALAAAVLLAGLYFTARTLQLNASSLELSREGQITERFTRAIDQLGQSGAEKIDVRLGGIYALERIASNSRSDHGPIMDVLTAFLREHARSEPGPSAVQGQPETDPPALNARTGVEPPADVQAVIRVLGRRNRNFDEPARRLDLSGIDLRGADLRGVHLEAAYLRNAHLEDADLSDAYLTGVSFRGAWLQRAILLGARLEAADLGDAHLEGTSLRGANLEDAALGAAQLSGADLADANLRRAFLGHARLEGANLSYANLEGASFPRAQLQGSVLYATRVDQANFDDCNMEGAKLSRTDLRAARGLTAAQIEAAITDQTTILPPSL